LDRFLHSNRIYAKLIAKGDKSGTQYLGYNNIIICIKIYIVVAITIIRHYVESKTK